MQNSLSWIEWLDRLDRVLKGAREDVRMLADVDSPLAVAAVERCTRQLSALTDELKILDRSVLAAGAADADRASADRAYNLQKALDTTVFRLGTMVHAREPESHSARERLLTAVDSALRDSCYEATRLLGPSWRPFEVRVN